MSNSTKSIQDNLLLIEAEFHNMAKLMSDMMQLLDMSVPDTRQTDAVYIWAKDREDFRDMARKYIDAHYHPDLDDVPEYEEGE